MKKRSMYVIALTICISIAFFFILKGRQLPGPKGPPIFFTNLKVEPELLHPIKSTDLYASIIQGYTFDSLGRRNLVTSEFEPYLAESWEKGSDGLTFIFKLREGVKWHDGAPLTAKDVVFSFSAYRDPAYGGMNQIPYFEKFQSFEALDDKTVKVQAKEPYFKNFSVLAGSPILPEHIYKDKDNKNLNKTLLGSGPYMLEKYDQGKQIILKQNPVWWGRNIMKDQYRIKKIGFRFVGVSEDVLMRLATGSLDFISPYTMNAEEYFTNDTESPPWGETIFRKRKENKEPSGFRYIGWNLKNPLFQDVRVRKALALLMNREMINSKILHKTKVLASGPIYSWSDYAPENYDPVPFDPKMAGQLLQEAGWRDTDRNGVLDKVMDGRKKEFRFSVLFKKDETMERMFTFYQQDLKKAGIVLDIQVLEWATLLKTVKDRKFEAACLGWHFNISSIDPDPKQIWHTESSLSMGSNFISYSNPEVDRLIDQGRVENNRQKRIAIFQRVYQLITEDHPYLFLYNEKFQYYAVSNKVEMEKDFYPYGLGSEFWQFHGTDVTISP